MQFRKGSETNWAGLAFGYLILTAATLLYASIVYVAAIALRQTESEPPDAGPAAFVRHVILIPGFFPWLITVVWVITLHSGASVLKGLGLIVLAVFVHYVVFAISAHSDKAYPWFQGVEVLVAVYGVASMIRGARRLHSQAAWKG